jgi:hypothetical protein
MILILPRNLVAFEKRQQFPPFYRLPRRFHQKSAAATGTGNGINLAEQVVWQPDMSSSGLHLSPIMCA